MCWVFCFRAWTVWWERGVVLESCTWRGSDGIKKSFRDPNTADSQTLKHGRPWQNRSTGSHHRSSLSHVGGSAGRPQQRRSPHTVCARASLSCVAIEVQTTRDSFSLGNAYCNDPSTRQVADYQTGNTVEEVSYPFGIRCALPPSLHHDMMNPALSYHT